MKTLGVEKAAIFLHISGAALLGLAESGAVPGAKIGECWLFTDEGLESYVRDEIAKQTTERRSNGAGQDLKKPVPTALSRVAVGRRLSPPPSLDL